MLQGIFFGSLMVAINPVVLLCGGEGVVGGAFRIPELHKIEPLRDPPTPLRALHTQRQGSLSPGTWASRLAIPVRSGGPWDISTQASTAALSVWQHLGGLEMNVLPPPPTDFPSDLPKGDLAEVQGSGCLAAPGVRDSEAQKGEIRELLAQRGDAGRWPPPGPPPAHGPQTNGPRAGAESPNGTFVSAADK